MTCSIIDDEPLAVKLLETYVARTPSLKHIASYASAVEAVEGLSENPVDLLFLDIQMPELSGMELARTLPRTTRVVFTTAFGEYAIEGYEVSALAYLLKPITYANFLRAVQRAQQSMEEARRTPGETLSAPASPDCIFIKSDYKILRIKVDDILYVEGLKDYIKIYTTLQPRPILSLTSMKSVEQGLPSGRFLRTHRSYVVNMQQVSSVERNSLTIGDKQIPISDSYKGAVLAYVNRRLLSRS